MTEPMLRFEHIGFAYDGAPVLRGVDLDIAAGAITALMGASGCGKSTLLAVAAGLLTPDAGRVHRHSKRLGIVFQEPALLPWRSARDNVAFALIADGLPHSARRARADTMLAAVGLSPEDADKYPRQLSGGMRQRVALARALAVEPDLLLCDEPFSALDAKLHAELWQVLREANARTGVTIVIVTHDADEAKACDRIVALAGGRISCYTNGR
jgi:NitT/TauT family transport system ATP-binding protein